MREQSFKTVTGHNGLTFLYFHIKKRDSMFD